MSLRVSALTLSVGLLLALSTAVGCSSSHAGSGPGATAGRSGGSGGGSNGSAGSSPNGESSAGSTSAIVEPGGPCTANCPTGRVFACYDNCPVGACDESGFAGEPCSWFYPTEINAQTIYCRKGQTATYCLDALAQNLLSYQVTCSNGTPSVTPCSGGCGVSSSGDAACGP